MKPTLGRIVLYTVSGDETTKVETNGAKVLPAVIVRVWSDTCVNLKVLTDGTNDAWLTSRTLGDQPGQWAWPTREG